MPAMRWHLDRATLPLLMLLLAPMLTAGQRSAAAFGYTVTPQYWSPWIKESGPVKGGFSQYTCPENQAMIGRKHKGDEDGDTSYLCGKIYYNGAEVPVSRLPAHWSQAMEESASDFICPVNTVMIGRTHWGDENGDTLYLCTPILYGNNYVTVRWGVWSAPIEESGKHGNGESSFTCPENHIMVGRYHQGDENGDTRYLCAKLIPSQSPSALSANTYFPSQEESDSDFTCPANMVMTYRKHEGDENGQTTYGCARGWVQDIDFTTSPPNWGPLMQEAGSYYVCPTPQVMVGRKHTGDENGTTQYTCAYVLFQGAVGQWGEKTLSDAMSEADSTYNCPTDEIMIGRQHQGDENRKTTYHCASIVMPFMPTTLSQATDAAVVQVGRPATTVSARFATRVVMQIDDDYFLQLDAGGEGYHASYGITSGFVGALNINAQENDSQPPFGRIPLLILVNSWLTSPPYPFASGTANYITMQGAPLTDYYVSEMARVIAPKGTIGLWIDDVRYQKQIDDLAATLHSRPVSSTEPGSTCFDEFLGKTGFPTKICIANNR
jgi:hypothetical protein